MFLYEITYERTVTTRETATITVSALGVSEAIWAAEGEEHHWDTAGKPDHTAPAIKSIERFTP